MYIGPDNTTYYRCARVWNTSCSTGVDQLGRTLDAVQFNRSVADNILSIDEHFWLRLAARNDAADESEKQKLSSLASTVMHLVEAAVAETEEQLTGSGKVVQEIMKSSANADGTWPMPLPDENVEQMKQVRCCFLCVHIANFCSFLACQLRVLSSCLAWTRSLRVREKQIMNMHLRGTNSVCFSLLLIPTSVCAGSGGAP